MTPKNSSQNCLELIVIGGGAAGFFGAISCAEFASENNIPYNIKILEASSRYLTKVKISGGGRCNVTHHEFDVRKFCENYPRGSKELLSPMQHFQSLDTVQWFKERGVPLVAENDGRMFPKTNTSQTIIDCFMNLIDHYRIQLIPRSPVQSIESLEGRGFEIKIKNQDTLYHSKNLLIATGSHPLGYPLVQSLGHRISERAPSLFSFKMNSPLLKDLQGLSFPTSKLKLTLPNKKTFKQEGPVLITHWGLSGPAVLKLSAWAAREMKATQYQGQLSINWLGFESPEEVSNSLFRIKRDEGKKILKNLAPLNIPRRFWLKILEILNIAESKKWADLSKKDAQAICNHLQNSRHTILGQNRFKEEFVECGGVHLKEIHFSTLESKLQKGLYFAGELLDVDGITGGFNFQNAWTTSRTAAKAMVENIRDPSP